VVIQAWGSKVTDEEHEEGMEYAMGLGNVKYNIQQLEKAAVTKKEKRTVQTFGAFLGVGEYPPPTIKMRLEAFFWNYIAYPYWLFKDWRENHDKEEASR
jgi:hypothetical protein